MLLWKSGSNPSRSPNNTSRLLTENEQRQKRPGTCQADEEATDNEGRIAGGEHWQCEADDFQNGITKDGLLAAKSEIRHRLKTHPLVDLIFHSHLRFSFCSNCRVYPFKIGLRTKVVIDRNFGIPLQKNCRPLLDSVPFSLLPLVTSSYMWNKIILK